jgi:hypothetical protein
MMTTPNPYQANKPQVNDLFSQSQIDFLNNFSTLYNSFLVNHVALDAAASGGNHTIIQLNEQTGNFQSNVGEISVYTRDAASQTDQLYLKYQGGAAEFQFTNYQLYSIQPQTNPIFQQYFTFLPGRILIYFGRFQANFQSSAIPLPLFPPIALNIVSQNYCFAGTTPFLVPVGNPVASQNGFIKSINLVYPLGAFFPGTQTLNYVVAANI